MQGISNDTMIICPLSWILSVYVEGIMVLKELPGYFKEVDNFHVKKYMVQCVVTLHSVFVQSIILPYYICCWYDTSPIGGQ